MKFFLGDSQQSFYRVLLGLCRVLGALDKYSESSSEEEVVTVGKEQHQLHRNSRGVRCIDEEEGMKEGDDTRGLRVNEIEEDM